MLGRGDACGCHSCPAKDARESLPGTLARGGVETSGTLGGDVVRNTVRSPVLAKLPERQTKKSFRSAYSHGSWFRNALFSRAGPVACDPALEFGSFHPRRAPSPVVEDSHTGPRRRSISREIDRRRGPVCESSTTGD